jgi:hypothetical protein
MKKTCKACGDPFDAHAATRRLTVLNAGPRSLEWFRLRFASLRLGMATGSA